MNKLANKIGSGIAAASLFALSATPAMAFHIDISGNGSWSDNEVDVRHESSVDIRQSNDTDIDNDVDVDQNTGGNEANDNTGGDVSIRTGDAESDVSIFNAAGANIAKLGSFWNNHQNDLEIEIQGNGHGSDNEVDIRHESNFDLNQSNDTDIDNDVNVDQNTGDNEANDNTGTVCLDHDWWEDSWFSRFLDNHTECDHDGGNVSIETGDAESEVSIKNLAGFNFFH